MMRWALPVLVVVTAAVHAQPADPAPADSDELAVVLEKIGPLEHGMTDAQVVKAAGAPTNKGTPKYAGEATGDWERQWRYPGATVTFYADTKKGPRWTIRRISVGRGSTWKTQRGIAVGATRAKVEKVYADVLNKDDSTDEVVIAGSIYGGIMFDIARGKVTSINIGAFAF